MRARVRVFVHVCEHMRCALMCLPACVCVSVYLQCTSVCMYLCMRERGGDNVCMCAHVRMRAYVCACVPVYVRACARACSAHVICLVNGGVNRCISGSEFSF